MYISYSYCSQKSLVTGEKIIKINFYTNKKIVKSGRPISLEANSRQTN